MKAGENELNWGEMQVAAWMGRDCKWEMTGGW